ncbi:MAG: ATP-binding protein [Anaerolineales bacterium]|jgi:PAS domain S-box-containing protein
MLPDFRIRQRDYLLETTRALSEELDLQEVLARIVRISAELLAGRASLIALREDSQWRIAAAFGIRPVFLKRVQRLLDDVPVHPVSAKRELPEVTARLERITDSASMGLLSSVGLPLIARDETIGVIFIFRAYASVFSAQDRDLLQAFAAQAAIAVNNARLYTAVVQQKAHLDTVVDSAADGIMILDRGLSITRSNRACARMTGIPETDAIGQPHGKIVRFAEPKPLKSLESAIEEGWPADAQDSLYVEGDLLRPDGSKTSVGITYAPVLSDQEDLWTIVANVRDITRFREAEELKSTFISVISHELRTPVALIKGYAGTLRREDAEWDPKVVREGLEVIDDESDRLAQLIDDLLDASRLQAGALPLNFSEVSLSDMAAKLAERFSVQAPDHPIRLSFPEKFPTIQGDEARLFQVLTNLISNAVKFSDQGGAITISGKSEAERATVCVEDKGPGILPEDRLHVFDRFYRSRAAASRTPGTGLGLYLAKAVVEAHGGEIWVDEDVLDGTRICFSLPIGSASSNV